MPPSLLDSIAIESSSRQGALLASFALECLAAHQRQPFVLSQLFSLHRAQWQAPHGLLLTAKETTL